MCAVDVMIQTGTPVVDMVARFDRDGDRSGIVAVGKAAALMEIFKFAVQEFSEKSFLIQTLHVHIFFGKRVVFQKIVDLAAFFHCFDKADCIAGAEECGNFAHDMFAGFQRADGMFSMIGQVGRDQYGIHIVVEKFFFIVGAECIRDFFLKIGSYFRMDVAAGNYINI